MGFDYGTVRGRPVIGIANSWSELNNCNFNLRQVAEAVKRGVISAGALPLEFPTISLGEEFMKPSAMLYRNLMAMEVEEMLRSNPIDGVVLLSNCDKTGPAQLMGAASANLPAIQVNGGPRPVSTWHGIEIGSGTDLWKYWDAFRTGRISAADWRDLEDCMSCGVGACNVMGTASTMSAIAEGLGMMLPGTSTICATDAERLEAAEASGRRIVEMVEQDVRPAAIMTSAAFDNTIRLLMALGGSTNALIHLIAIAGRLGLDLPLERFDEIGGCIPCIVNLKPSGEHHTDRLHAHGGIPAVMKQIERHLEGSCRTASGQTWEEVLSGVSAAASDVVRSVEAPVAGQSVVVLRGNLVPRGAVLKVAAASPDLFRHTGRAVVFENYEDMLSRVDRPELDVSPDSVLVLRNCGPKGAPGMPEWGSIPIPAKLVKQGVKDMVRISDARISGTCYGTLVVHACPEAAAGGPLAIVRDGDEVSLDVPARRLDLLLPDSEREARRSRLSAPASPHLRGYPRLFMNHVLQADEGCDFDVLRPRTMEELRFVPPVVGRS
jgi:dihydroxy-acid dehydratase